MDTLPRRVWRSRWQHRMHHRTPCCMIFFSTELNILPCHCETQRDRKSLDVCDSARRVDVRTGGGNYMLKPWMLERCMPPRVGKRDTISSKMFWDVLQIGSSLEGMDGGARPTRSPRVRTTRTFLSNSTVEHEVHVPILLIPYYGPMIHR
ncbi:hypothetical protein EV363DRAFT_959456 [Boletus edulis]|nr:hypothetical protein EV363DRAFT_959456 [Boletus edulis]